MSSVDCVGDSAKLRSDEAAVSACGEGCSRCCVDVSDVLHPIGGDPLFSSPSQLDCGIFGVLQDSEVSK